jgi:Ca2+-binding EF-hand superfamily protein
MSNLIDDSNNNNNYNNNNNNNNDNNNNNNENNNNEINDNNNNNNPPENEQNEFEKELREAFNDFDEDHSGGISKEELGHFMRKLGYRPTLVELQEMIDEVGKDQQGQIGFEEFKQIMTKTIRDEFTQNSSIEAFAVFDKNKTGKIKKENLQNILLTKGDQNMTDHEVYDLLDNYIDFDENGEINYKDFVKQTFDLFK